MVRKKLFKLFSNLSEIERESFSHFLKIPIFNGLNDVKILNTFLNQFVPNFEDFYSDEVLSKKIYPDTPFKPKRVMMLFTRFGDKLKNFLLALEAIEQKSVKKQLQLANIYRKRQLDDLFLDTLDKAEKRLDAQYYPLPDYYEQKRAILHERYFSLVYNKSTIEANDTMEQIMDMTDEVYILRKLLYAHELKNRELSYGTSSKILLIDEIKSLKDDRKQNELSSILFNIQSYFNSIESTSLEDFYFKLKDKILDFVAKDPFDSLESSILLKLLKRCAVKLMNKGDIVFQRELYYLYLLGIEKKHLNNYNFVDEQAFVNTVILGTKTGDDMSNFIKRNSRYLKKKYKEEIRKFCKAYVFFHQGKFQEVRSKLKTVDFHTSALTIQGKALYIKASLESLLTQELTIREIHHFENELSNFEKYLKRNPDKLNSHFIKSEITFIRFVRKFKRRYINKNSILKLKNQISNSINFNNKEWLIKKMELISY